MPRSLISLLLAALGVLLLCPAGAAAETRTFTAAADAFVAAARPSANYGRQQRLILSRSTRVAYVKFRVSLPAGSTVTGARVRLYKDTPRRSPLTLQRAASGWTERGVSWGNRPRAVSGVLARDRARHRGWRALGAGAVTAGVQSFLLRTAGGRPLRLLSRESGRAPELVVTYETPRPVTDPSDPPGGGCPVPRPQTTWRPPGSALLSDEEAVACVSPSAENRPQNAEPNAKVPTAAELEAFRTARDQWGRTPAQYNRNLGSVTGAAAAFGLRSTDDIIEWAAYKWGVPEDFVRGQMVMESGWSMLQRGDRRDWATPVEHEYPALAVIDADSVWESLGIAQIRWRHTVPWNPGVEPLRWQSTGFALDYSQALIRYYYDGYCDWCGEGYRAGDGDGAYRTYVSGSWTDGQWYADGVRQNAASKPWEPL